MNKSIDQCSDRFHVSAHISLISFLRVEGYSTSRRIDKQKGAEWKSRVKGNSRVFVAVGLLFDLRNTRVFVCRNVHGGCARYTGRTRFPLTRVRKFMTRNGNWCVVKPAPYAPDLIEIILPYFQKLNLSVIIHWKLNGDFNFVVRLIAAIEKVNLF